MREPRFVVIGGGNGLSNLLKGLKRFSSEITAIVTVADDGGGSGILREEAGILPPGDIRNCLIALSDTEPTLEKLLNYRFPYGANEGQNFGNLFIAALMDIYGSFEEAIKRTSQVLNITGEVLPVTTEDIRLKGRFADGTEIIGESKIPLYGEEEGIPIEEITLIPREVKANEASLKAIQRADFIVLGPGSLYTSLIPNLLIPEILREIKNSRAPLAYIANLMTQRGETDSMDLLDHVEALERHGLAGEIDYIILNTETISESILSTYEEREHTRLVAYDSEDLQRLEEKNVIIEKGDFMEVYDGLITHNSLIVSQRLLTIADQYRF